jgi:hypothetical protein
VIALAIKSSAPLRSMVQSTAKDGSGARMNRQRVATTE